MGLRAGRVRSWRPYKPGCVVWSLPTCFKIKDVTPPIECPTIFWTLQTDNKVIFFRSKWRHSTHMTYLFFIHILSFFSVVFYPTFDLYIDIFSIILDFEVLLFHFYNMVKISPVFWETRFQTRVLWNTSSKRYYGGKKRGSQMCLLHGESEHTTTEKKFILIVWTTVFQTYFITEFTPIAFVLFLVLWVVFMWQNICQYP